MNSIKLSILLLVLALWLIFFSGCTSPLVSVNRTGPLLQSDITIQDSANNNEIPLFK